MAENQASQSPGASPAGEPTPERPVFVHVMILLAATMFVAMMVLLYYQWLTKWPPNAIIFVEGTAAYDGARAWVEDGTNRRGIERQLNESGKYSCRFPVTAGRGPYTLRIKMPDGAVEEKVLTNIAQYQMVTFSLMSAAVFVEGNKTHDGTAVWLESPNGQRLGQPQTLLARNNYTAHFMVHPDVTDAKVRIALPGGATEDHPIADLKHNKRVTITLTRSAASGPARFP